MSLTSRLAFILLSGASAISLQAKTISSSEAKRIADEFLGEKCVKVSTAPLKINRLSENPESAPFYIFNKENGNGFVIISGDDVLPSVLGYSDRNSFDTSSTIPPQLEWLLNGYAAGIIAVHNGEAPVTMAGQKEPVLLKTADWGQLEPYNSACPLKYYTGCGATTMAILMNYYQYPQKGNGSHSYVWNRTRLSFNFETPLKWDLMLDSYADGNYTTEEANAVAQLMKGCGTILEMNYSPVESTSYASNFPRIAKFMGYSNNCEYIEKVKFNISDNDWFALIDSHLDRNRPVPYRGANAADTGGHIFILDGRDGKGLYHLNWGWDGQYNGYYNLAALTPAGHQYSYNQGMVINAYPAPEDNFLYSTMTTTGENQSIGLSINREDIKADDTFYACVSGLKNRGIQFESGELALALVDSEGNIKDVTEIQNFGLQPSYYYTTFTFPEVSFSTDATEGDRVQLVHRVDDESEWQFVIAGYGTLSSLPAFGHKPDYCSLTWKVDPRISIQSYNGQHKDRGLKNNRYDFYVSFDTSEVERVRIYLNGRANQYSNGGWVNFPLLTADNYEIEVRGYPELPGSADEIIDDSISTDTYVFTPEGIALGCFKSIEEADEAIANYPSGIYIIRCGDKTEKRLSAN